MHSATGRHSDHHIGGGTRSDAERQLMGYSIDGILLS